MQAADLFRRERASSGKRCVIHANRTNSADAPLVPPPCHVQVWLDFDGTISRLDVLDELIRKFAIDDSWKVAERCWQEGRIGSRECLQAQFACVRIDPQQLDEFLETIELDSGLLPLLALLRSHHIPVAILSDGIDMFIERALKRQGVRDLPIRSNSISHQSNHLTMLCPHQNDRCDSDAAHCKCASAQAMASDARKSIYVGDGRSDLCAARRCDVVFAKGTLAACLSREKKSHYTFETLNDVVSVLNRAWSEQTAETEASLSPQIRG